MSMVMEPVTRVGVTVTFMRMNAPPSDAAPALPGGMFVRLLPDCTVEQYRFLYNTVGAAHVWWLRRTVPDRQIAALLRDPRVNIYVLLRGQDVAGFYELDSTNWPLINLSYFGLMPGSVGQGFGYAFLRNAVDTAWRQLPNAMTVNTCNADHPRAMPTYRRAGFVPVREVREEWNVPVRLGLDIPERLKL